MGVKLHIGLSRKVGEANHALRGASLTLEFDADDSTIDEPARLREQVRQLFALLRSCVDEELSRATPPSVANGHWSRDGRPLTPAQRRAILALARDTGVDLREVLREHYGLEEADGLSLRQASRVIDYLRDLGSG